MWHNLSFENEQYTYSKVLISVGRGVDTRMTLAKQV